MKRVLLVEDNDADAFLLGDAFEVAGTLAEIVRVRDGVAALHTLDGGGGGGGGDGSSFDLVLLDLELPRLSGEDVLRRLHERAFAGPPVVILSGSCDPLEEERCRTLGARDFQTKPASPEQYEHLAQALRDRWLRPEP